MELQCPNCEGYNLELQEFSDVFDHPFCPFRYQVHGLRGHICMDCGADPMFKEQILENELLIREVRTQRFLDYLAQGF
jgi:hypothetical protein